MVLYTILLDPQKAHDNLDWDRCLDILAGYGVGTRTLRILLTYCDRMQMADKDGGYFGPPLKGYLGVTQGDPMYLTIFYMVVDDAIRHWVTVVAPTETGAEEIKETIQELEDFFYADNGLVVLPRPERLQRVFNVLIYLFNQIGLQKNVQKTVSMAYRP